MTDNTDHTHTPKPPRVFADHPGISGEDWTKNPKARASEEAAFAYTGAISLCLRLNPMKKRLFSELQESAYQAVSAIKAEKEASSDFHLDPIDIRRIRNAYHLTQKQFSSMLGVSERALRNWEHGQTAPRGPALVLLQIALIYPYAFYNTLVKYLYN